MTPVQCTLPLDGFAEPVTIPGTSPGNQAASGQGSRRRRTPAQGTGQQGVAAAAALAESMLAGPTGKAHGEAAKAAEAGGQLDVARPAPQASASELAAESPAPVVALTEPRAGRGRGKRANRGAAVSLAGEPVLEPVMDRGATTADASEAKNEGNSEGKSEAVPAAACELALTDAAPADAAPLTLGEQLANMRVVVFDVETTGTDRRNDQVIELGVQTGLDQLANGRTWRFRPDVPIHPGAQAVHGISMAELEGCPAFRDCLDEVAAVFERAEVIIGYNIAFDIDMLAAEYERAGRKPIDFSGKTIIDAFRLWQQCEPRSLQHAHQRFVGDRFTAAHSASADVAATGRVLTGMLRAFGLEQQDWVAIAGLCDPQRATWIGPTRHLRWESGVVTLGFGKHAGAALHKVAHGPDRSFLRWVLDRDFPPHVVEICRAALELASRVAQAEDVAEPISAWVRERFGAPSAASAAPAALSAAS